MSDLTIINEEGVVQCKTPKVKTIHPFGSTILIEILNPDEVLGTSLYIDKGAKVSSCPQAYIVALGSSLKDDVGLKAGDRVMIQGTYHPVDNLGDNQERKWGIIEMHNIKAILEEEA
jgi:hypothetical protein